MRLEQLVTTAKTLRDLLAHNREAAMMNFIKPPLGGPTPKGLPLCYGDLLGVADGFVCGGVVLFELDRMLEMQFYADPATGSGVTLRREDWLCVGLIHDDPWYVKRDDCSIWTFPDLGIPWWQSHRFVKTASSLEAFILDYVWGSGYQVVAGEIAGDLWVDILRLAGRMVKP